MPARHPRPGGVGHVLALAAVAAAPLVLGIGAAACNPVDALAGERVRNGPATGTGNVAPAGTQVAIVYERTSDLALQEVTATFRVDLEGADLEAADLILPSGARETLDRFETPSKSGAIAVRLGFRADADEASILSRFPPGPYTIEVTRAGGVRATITVLASGQLPDLPSPIFPPDQATAVPLGSEVTWSGPFVRYDVVLIDEDSQAEVALATATGDHAVQPAVPFAPGRAYRLEIRARAGVAFDVTEHRSTVVVRFTTGEA